MTKAELKAEVIRLRTQLARQGRRARPAAALDPDPPPTPPRNERGNYPAIDFVRASIADEIVRRRRRALGWTQADLAAAAGVRLETVNRLEGGKHSPNVRTVDKIDAALTAAGA